MNHVMFVTVPELIKVFNVQWALPTTPVRIKTLNALLWELAATMLEKMTLRHVIDNE